ncbi:outer membrane lipoprotein carrier protein LolA [Halosolutus amylolyticus]|uniref:Outer membrane lipoprotein carrier protein LolA n=1 Tax=Halosolutus amylolyticus TaxID=2932267 RepID=A0ABD5PQI9_9EURY|nr:DUF2092 domain-containing protein [Halosolutus amylolyticus]
MNRRRLLAVGAIVSLAGCSTTVERSVDSNPDPEDVIRDAIETRKGVDSIAGRRTVTAESAETDGGEMKRTERIYERPPANQRLEVLDATNAVVSPGTVTVTTRPITWEYDPTENEAIKRHHPHRVFADRVRLVLEDVLEECCLTYEGTDTVAGRETHVIEVAPPADADVERSIDILVGDTRYVIPLEEVPQEELDDAEVIRTIYITEEERYPIKERNVVTTGETELHSLTAAFEEVTIDGDLDDEVFTYDPPADADVSVTGLEPEGIYDSPATAETVAPYDLPDPDLPEPYELDRVTVVETDARTTTTLWYLDPEWPEREIYVSVRDEPRFNEDVLERVEVNDHEGFYRDGRVESVFWNCGGLSYEVSSPDVAEPVVEIAETIDCD